MKSAQNQPSTQYGIDSDEVLVARTANWLLGYVTTTLLQEHKILYVFGSFIFV